MAPQDSSRGPSAVIEGAWKLVLLLIAVAVLNYIDRQVLAAVVPQIRVAFFSHPEALQSGFTGVMVRAFQKILGGSPEDALIGALPFAFMITYMILAPIFGTLKTNRWWIIGGGVAVWSVATALCGMAHSFPELMLYRCFVGVGEAAFGPFAGAIIADLYPVEKRGRVMAYFYMMIPVGSALGYVVGGKLGFPNAFYAVLPPGLLLALICFTIKDMKVGASDNVVNPVEVTVKDYIKFLKCPSYILCTIGQTLMTFAIGGMGFWMPSYINEFRGVPDLAAINTTFGLILVVSGITGTLAGGYLGDLLKPRFPGSYFMISGIAMIIAFPLFLGVLYMPFPGAWVWIFFMCFCLFFNTGPSNTILANVTHPALRAGAFAVNIFIIHAFGDVLSPMVIGAITDATGKNMTYAFLVVSFLVLIGGVVWLAGIPFLKRDEERAVNQLGK